jgi:hypothetical protein
VPTLPAIGLDFKPNQGRHPARSIQARIWEPEPKRGHSDVRKCGTAPATPPCGNHAATKPQHSHNIAATTRHTPHTHRINTGQPSHNYAATTPPDCWHFQLIHAPIRLPVPSPLRRPTAAIWSPKRLERPKKRYPLGFHCHGWPYGQCILALPVFLCQNHQSKFLQGRYRRD